MTERPNALDLAWVAGLFEGEGTFTITMDLRRGGTRARAMLASTDAEVIEPFQRWWPGVVRWVQPKRGNARPALTWELNAGDAIRRFVLDVQPYLRTERVQAKAALLLADVDARTQGSRDPGYRQRCQERALAMRRLNHRGSAPAP